MRHPRPRPERQDSPDTAGLHGGWARPVRDRGTGAGKDSLIDRADSPIRRARLAARAQPVNQGYQLRSLSFEYEVRRRQLSIRIAKRDNQLVGTFADI